MVDAPRTPTVAAPGRVATLAALWRTVYKKAAEAAEARAVALLNAHAYDLHGRRGIAVIFDGGGADLQPGQKCDLELPWQYQLEGWALYADREGDLDVELLRAPRIDDYPTMGSVTPNADTRPKLAAAQKAHSEDTTDWLTPLPRGAILRVQILTAATIRLATLTLYVRAI